MAPFDRPYATFYWSAIVNIDVDVDVERKQAHSLFARLNNTLLCLLSPGSVLVLSAKPLLTKKIVVYYN